MENERLTVEFDDGAVIDFEIVGTFEVKGVDYIALMDIDTQEDYLFRYIDKGDEFELADIPEEEFDEVAEEYDKIMESLGEV